MTVSVTESELRRALNELMLAAAPFAYGRGMPEPRGNLKCAMHKANEILNTKPCALTSAADLRTLADQADAERQARPDYRRDVEG